MSKVVYVVEGVVLYDSTYIIGIYEDKDEAIKAAGNFDSEKWDVATVMECPLNEVIERNYAELRQRIIYECG